MTRNCPPAEYWALLHEAERRHGGPLVSDRSKLEMMGLDYDEEAANLTGYWHATVGEEPVTDVHGHYIEGCKVSIPIVHEHKGGHRVHFHEEANGLARVEA